MNRDYYAEVTEKEFKEFIDKYPGKLEADWCMICFPEVLCFYDFTRPEETNLVAGKSYDFKDPAHYEGQYTTYWIRKELRKKSLRNKSCFKVMEEEKA